LDSYPRSLEVRSAVVGTCSFTNDDGLSLSATIATNRNFTFEAGSWTGGQFRIPLLAGSITLPYSAYRRSPEPHFDSPGQTNRFEAAFGLYTNRWGLTVTSRIFFFVLDGDRVIDCVVLSGLKTGMDVSSELNRPTGPLIIDNCWSV